ncbi:hypothetical protein QMK33_08865 [Hymenobacter sp. H14-R3]|uniref:hypothetical protein n=1 Tax=Hymenobacter sp. H14-R3 TaxID=3046308 RepID=UPI0024BBCD0C|nr:hypothetical protein [Hymenobacter sp. H14-R3]MDJ0365263.1 hypothetical protein [Hymenobacter sp. H14-R3]
MSSSSPVAAYLRLRFILLGRLLREIGWLRLGLAGPLLALGLLQTLDTLSRQPHGLWAVPLLVGWSVLGAHRQRADAQWLATAAPGHRPWLAAEYALLALPLALGLLGLRAYGPAAALLGLAALVAWAPPARAPAATRHRWRSPFRSEAFEWVGGARATKALWLWPLLVGLAAWQRASALAPIAALVAWLLVVLACYGTPEPVTMLALAARTPRQFLRRRLALGLGYAAATALPFWLLLGAGPAGGGPALGVALFWLALVGMVILTKYAFYPVASHIRLTQGVVLAIGLLGAWHPAYPPLMLTIAAGLGWQSQRRLRQVLGDSVL